MECFRSLRAKQLWTHQYLAYWLLETARLVWSSMALKRRNLHTSFPLFHRVHRRLSIRPNLASIMLSVIQSRSSTTIPQWKLAWGFNHEVSDHYTFLNLCQLKFPIQVENSPKSFVGGQSYSDLPVSRCVYLTYGLNPRPQRHRTWSHDYLLRLGSRQFPARRRLSDSASCDRLVNITSKTLRPWNPNLMLLLS